MFRLACRAVLLCLTIAIAAPLARANDVPPTEGGALLSRYWHVWPVVSSYRWGDYSTMSVDPVDGCTMVFTTEYIPSNGSFNWATAINSLKLSSCQ